MKRNYFGVRIDQETEAKIDSYRCYLNTITGCFLNMGDINRAIVSKGIDTLIEENGGLGPDKTNNKEENII